MKNLVCLPIIILYLFSGTIHSQNKLFLEKKGFYDYKGAATFSLFPTVSEDNTLLTVSSTLSEKTTTQLKMDYSSIILNLTTGRVEGVYEGAQSYFIKNDLFFNDMSEFSGTWFKSEKIIDFMSDAPYYILNPATGEKSLLNFPKKEIFTGISHGYITTIILDVMMMNSKSFVYERKGNALKKIGTFDILVPFISTTGKEIYGLNPFERTLKFYDINSGKLNSSVKLDIVLTQYYLTKDNKLILKELVNNNGTESNNIFIRERYSNRILTTLPTGPSGTVIFRVNEKGDELIMVNQETAVIKYWSIPSGELLAETVGTFVDKNNSRTKDAGVYPLDSKGKFYIINYSNGIMSLFSSKERKIIAELFVDGIDWAVIARDGRVDGTPGAFKKLEWQEYDSNNKLINTTSLDATFSNFYTPRLLYTILNEESETDNILVEQLNNTPTIKIKKPADNFTSINKEIELKVTANYFNDPIKEIMVYLNGKLIDPEEIYSERNETEYSKTYNLYLLPGENKIKCKAVSFNDYESEPDEITIQYGGTIKKTTDLYMLVIGINNYLNPKYKLNYALADASAFKDIIETGSQSIFKNTDITCLSDSEASKKSITEAFNTIKSKALASDVFIFYYAGHGVMSEEQKSEFFIAPYDVTQLYGNNDMLRTKGISAEELRNFSKELYAQKQLFVFDACQSGGLVDLLATRGVAEEKAIAQLARSTGTYWLTASNSEQFATEFEELGHGLFTYTILEGLGGAADGSVKDKKITVKEISAYINDMIPQLSKKYKGSAQFPNSYGFGQDFPIKIIK